MPSSIDPHSPVPLFHQIAESIRAEIESGSLQPGDALTPLREAAERWGVNVHTVRHAYTALARDGLLRTQRGIRGTRVIDSAQQPEADSRRAPSLHEFLDAIVFEARLRHGLDAAALADALSERASGATPRVYVVECSRWQAECHARELSARYQIDAVAWPLHDGEPPEGTVLTTYFHYNDVRRLWPRRLGSVRFIAIHPDPALRELLADTRSVWVCEMDEDTASAAAADLSVLFKPGRPAVRTKVAADPNDLVPRRGGRGVPHLFAPRAWSALTEEARVGSRVFELRYTLDSNELESLAAEEGWHPASRSHSRGSDEAEHAAFDLPARGAGLVRAARRPAAGYHRDRVEIDQARPGRDGSAGRAATRARGGPRPPAG